MQDGAGDSRSAWGAALAVVAVMVSGCDLFGGSGPGPDTGVPAGQDGGADDGAVEAPPVARRARLLGPWPQASRDESVEPRSVGRTYVIDRRAAAGSDTPFTTVACAEGCGEACGLAFEVAADRRVADAQVVTGPDDRVYVHVLEGPSAERVTSPDGFTSRILVASSLGDSMLGREPITPDLVAAYETVQGRPAPGPENLRLVVRDMFVLGHSPTSAGGADGAHALVLFGHLFDRGAEGAPWAVRDVFLALDSATGRLLFTGSLPEEVFTQFAPGLPAYRALGAAITRDGRLLALRAGRVVTRGQLFAARIPGLQEDGSIVPDGAPTHVSLAPWALEGTSASAEEHDVLSFGLDDQDRVWSIGGVAVRAAACAADVPAPDQLRLRVHGPDGALIQDLPDPSRTFAAVRALRVERRADAPATWTVMVLGDRPVAPRCLDARNQFGKSPTTFTDDEDAIDSCPRRFEALCRSAPSACPCRGCDGVRQECAPPIGETPGQVLVAWTFDGAETSPGTLALRRVSAVAADGVTSFSTDRRGHALLAGHGLSFVELDAAEVERQLRWTVSEWDTTSGLFESEPLSSLEGGWQTPLFDTARGERFVAGLRSTHVTSTPGPGPLITRTASEWGNLVTGMLGSLDLMESRTIARERLETADVASGHAEVDRVFPLARGRLLHVFHWAGPPVAEGAEATRRLELRLAVPQDTIEYARARDLAVTIGFDAVSTPICETDDDDCGHPLGAPTSLAEVSTEPPTEVSCALTLPDGTANPACTPGELGAAAAAAAGATLATTPAGRIAVTCTPAGLTTRREAETLFATCTEFTERFQPDTRRAGDLSRLSIGMVSLQHRADPSDACELAGRPVPLRLLQRSPLSRPSATDELGAEVTAVQAGAPIHLKIPAFYAPTAQWRLVSGAATLVGGAAGMTSEDMRELSSSQLLTALPAASGGIVLAATLRGPDGEDLGTRTIGIGVLGRPAIVVNGTGDAPLAASGSTESACDTGATVTPASGGAPVPECTLRAAIMLVNERAEGCGDSPCVPARVFFDLPADAEIAIGSSLPILLAPASFVAGEAGSVRIAPSASLSGAAGLVAELSHPDDGVRLERIDVVGFDGPLIDVERAGTYGDGGVPTDRSPALVLAGVHLDDGGDDGVRSSGPVLLVVGTRGTRVSGNAGWGIRAREISTHGPSATVGLTRGAFERTVISRNERGGVYLTGAIPRSEEDVEEAYGALTELTDVSIEDNGGPGVITTLAMRFASATISRNGGPGVALVRPDHDAGIGFTLGLEPSVVADNRGDGIYAERGPVDLTGPVTVSGNAGWGVRTSGTIACSEFLVAARAPSVVSRNGGGPSCVFVELTERGASPTTSERACDAGGLLGTLDSRTSESRLFDLSVVDNFGPGVIVANPLTLGRVRIEDNDASGVVYGATDGSRVVVGLRLDGGVVIARNAGHGAASTGTISASGPIDVDGNGGSGLYAPGADIVLDTVAGGAAGRTTIRGNGVGTCEHWEFAGTVEPAPSSAACDLGGVVTLDGRVRGSAFDVRANAGPGIWADSVTLVDVDVCGHSEPIRAATQMLTDVELMCP